MKKIIGIKVEKIIALVKKVEIIFIIIIPNNDISNNIGFNEFEKTIQKMQQKNSNNENNYNSQKNEIILNKEINMKNKNCNFVNNNNSNIIKKNEINLNKKQNKKINKKNNLNNQSNREIPNKNLNSNKNKYQKNKVKKEEEKLLDDLKKDINDKFNNLEGINELDNCIKQLDYLLAKSKEN